VNVGIIHPYFDVIGGAEMTTFSLIEALEKQKNCQVTLYTVIPPKVAETENFKIRKISKSGIPSFWRYQRMKEVKRLFKISKRSEILLIMSGGLALDKTDAKKTILYCNSTFSSDKAFLEIKSSGLRRIYLNVLQNNVRQSIEYLKSARTNLISNSDYTKNKIMDNFGKNSVVIYPPVKILEFEKLKRIPKTHSITTVSRFSPEKNLDFAINVMKDISNMYSLIGNAVYDSQWKLYERIAQNASENMSIHCNLEQDMIRKIVAESKVYFHASEETFGISVVESIAAGCIPIVPDNSAHRETVPFKELRYVPYDIEDAQAKVKSALSGAFDGLSGQLQNHVQKFSEEIFQRSFLNHIMN
jgi:glycosyltransferase involved in cell wall biosynthesis